MLDPSRSPSRPQTRVRRHAVQPAGLAPLEALVAAPEKPGGLLFHFPGFNIALGSWEAVRYAQLAEATGLAVVAVELPGLSRFGHRLPGSVRRDLMDAHADSWAELCLGYLRLAARQAGFDRLPVRQLTGFSTGCSLAAAVGRQLEVASLGLIEPVSVTERSLVELEAANLADLARFPAALTTNRDWVAHAWRAQLGEQGVRYSVADLLAIARLLSGRTIPDDLSRPAWCLLARGERSSLCPRPAFEALDAQLAAAGVPGPSLTVAGLGHQLWHSFGAVAALSGRLPAASDRAGTGEYPGRPLS